MPKPPTLATAAFDLPQTGLRLAVVADTHSAPHPRTADRIRELAPAAILHAGDIGDVSVLDRLSELGPVLAVRGNIDARGIDRPDALVIDIRSAASTVLKILLVHIAVYGPRLRADVMRLATRHEARLVVCGHSHVPFIGRQGGITMFNPGSIGPRRFSLPIVLGAIDIDTQQGVRLRHIDCETGQTWLPPGVG